MKYSKNDLIQYRLDRAFEALEEANILAENSHWNAVANRLYYSCFYAVNAVFIKKDITARSHTGTKSQFHLHFIKTKKLDKNFGYIYSKLFTLRNAGDYEDFINYDKKSIEPLISQVNEFIHAIKTIIDSDDF